MTRPTDRTPDALVLIASPALGGALQRVRQSGWAGPVVVVGDVDEATELARALQHRTRHGDGPAGPPPASSAGGAGLMLDPDRRMVVSGDRRAGLTPLEYDVLHALLVEPGRVRLFAELTEQAWGTPYVGDTTQVHSVVKRVRRKLDSIASPIELRAVRGTGLRAVARPRPSLPPG